MCTRALPTCAAALRSIPCAGPEDAAGLACGAVLPEGPAAVQSGKGAALVAAQLLALQRTAATCLRHTRDLCVLQAETWKVIAGLPWVIKPIYGFISDTVPIFGMRRRPYLVGCGLVGAPSQPCAPHEGSWAPLLAP